jgi:hypothetical protein
MNDISIVSIAELSDPYKLIQQFDKNPVAISNGQKVIGYFVPRSAISDIHITQATDKLLGDFMDNKLPYLSETLNYLKER